MKVLFSGATICETDTLKRLLLVADEIGFMDRPSITFKDWGTVGVQSEIRTYDTTDSPVAFSAHSPPSGPATKLYERYIEADLAGQDFVSTFREGLAGDDRFAAKFIQPAANYSGGTGEQIRASIVGDEHLADASFSDPVNGGRMFQCSDHDGRRETLKTMLIQASIHVTNAQIISEGTGLIPVSDDPFLCRLLALRSSNTSYVEGTPRIAADLGIAVARAVIPDEALKDLSVSDVFDYRKSAKDAYDAWAVEINRLGAQIADLDPDSVQAELPRIINTDVKPRLVEYRNEMKSVRDRLFGELVKKVAKWEVPSLSLAYLASLGPAAALAMFASALAPAIPAVVDYYRERRDVRRRNSMAYLAGVSDGSPEDR